MRRRLARDLPAQNPWDVKHRDGGLMEVEFVAQALLLAHAPWVWGAGGPAAGGLGTGAALRRLRRLGVLAPADARLLEAADRTWRTVQSLLRITVGARPPPDLPEPALEALERDLGLPGEGAARLHETLEATGRAVRAAFERLVGEVR